MDDFTFEQASTRAVFSASTGTWSIDDGYGTVFRFGIGGDIPTVTNAGDGFAAVGVFRPSNDTWYQASPTGSIAARTQWGASGDIPVQAHYSGISRPTVLATFRPSNGIWYLRGVGNVAYGRRGDIPVPGHYAGTAAGDYTDHPAIFRPSNDSWYVPGARVVRYGIHGDIPVPGDYNGDGRTDVAVYRPSTHTWYVRGQPSRSFGTSTSAPIGKAPSHN